VSLALLDGCSLQFAALGPVIDNKSQQIYSTAFRKLADFKVTEMSAFDDGTTTV
jgi:hypothetical protein